MKTRTLFKGIGLCLAVLILAGFGCAYDTTLDTQGIGWNNGEFYEYQAPHRFTGGSNNLYFMVRHAGLVNISLANCPAGGSGASITCSYINYTDGVQTTHKVLPVAFNNNCSSAVWNWSYANFTIDSNVGIFFCSKYEGSGSLYISPDASYVTYPEFSDYSARTFVAGSTYMIPLLNRYYTVGSPSTVISTGSNADFQGTENPPTGLYYTSYTPSCDETSGGDVINVDNHNSTDSQHYYLSANFTTIPSMDITTYTPTGNNIVAVGESITFTITTNVPEAVDAVVWYIRPLDNSTPTNPVQNSQDYSYTRTFSSAGTYLVEAQLEDDNCWRFTTTNWTVVVTGGGISLEGYVKGDFLNGSVNQPLSGATVSLQLGGTRRSATTASDGYYSITGLSNGTYNLSFDKPGFARVLRNLSLFDIAGGSPVFYEEATLTQLSQGVGSWNVAFLDGGKNTALSGFSFEVTAPTGLAAYYDPVAGLIDSGVYTVAFAGNTLNLSNIPLGDSVTVSVSKIGFKASSGDFAATATKTIEVVAPTYSSTLYLYNITGGGVDNGTVVVGHTSLTASFPFDLAHGEYAEVQAMYTYDGSPILGASCHYTSDCFSYIRNSLQWDGSKYVRNVRINCEGGTTGSVEVECSKDGYSSLSKTLYFNVAAEDEQGLKILFKSKPNFQRTYVNNTLGFWVKLTDMNNVIVPGATCALVWNGTSYPLTYSAYQDYRVSFIATTAGAFEFYAQCNKTGYTSETTPTELGIILLTTPVLSSCADGVKNYDETDIDCGGTLCSKCSDGLKCRANADCMFNYCLAGTCSTPSCSDGVRNGNETGIDCGGSCASAFGMYCMCFTNWDCDATGSETCLNNSCVRDVCTTTCPSIWWSTSANPLFLRERVCNDGTCFFRSYSPNQTQTNEMIVSPLSPYYYNNSGTLIYVSNCEQGNNGFKVTTNRATQKLYFHDYTALSPSVPASTTMQSFDSNYALVASGTLPALCQIPVGSDYIYALTTFKAHEQGGKEIAQSVYSLTFRKAFVFNLTKQSGILYINASRVMSCIYRTAVTDAWANVSGAGTVLSIPNATEANYYVACNSSFGEVYATTYGKGGVAFSLVLAAWKLGTGLGAGLFAGLFGVDFVYETWYIVPLTFMIFLGLPIMIILGYFMLNRKKQHG